MAVAHTIPGDSAVFFDMTDRPNWVGAHTEIVKTKLKFLPPPLPSSFTDADHPDPSSWFEVTGSGGS